MIWLIGNKGMLGTDVEKKLVGAKLDYIASDKELDITNYESISDFFLDKDISWIINCSAYTAVDKAEDERELAFKINSDGVMNIARLALKKNARLIHISTDYVFDGSKEGAYTENDKTNPIGVYGLSKLEGEKNIQNTISNYFILRTAWLYGRNGTNFIYTMLKLFSERNEIRVVNDQWGSPTYSVDLADVIIKIITDNSDRFGIYNFTNSGKTNWHEFALAIFNNAKGNALLSRDVKIIPITTEEYPTKAKRPKNSYLSKEKIAKELGIEIRPWQEALVEFIYLNAKNKQL